MYKSKEKSNLEKPNQSWVLVTHACNTGYSVGRDQDCGKKPDWANSSRDPISKNPSQKWGW
jgi:hypothetical protein